MHRRTVLLNILALLFLLPFSTVFAEEENKFDGNVGIGVIAISSGNNLNPSGSKKVIDSLDEAADKEITTLPLIIPSLKYNLNDNGAAVYFDTTPPIDEVGGFAINIGTSYPVENVGIFDTSLYFTPFEAAYKNPYLVGEARSSTSTSKYGVKLAWNKIMGSNFRVNGVFMNDDVDDDVIGQLMPEMARDGGLYALNANYSYYVSKTFELRPRVGIRRGNYEGSATSFMKYKFDLEGRYKAGKLMMIPRIFYSYSEYDETNPIFDETRQDNGYGINLMTNYFAPFGLKDWAAQMILGYSRGDSNITFYDTEGITAGLFMSYVF